MDKGGAEVKNSLADLNNYLFESIERLMDDDLDDEGLERENARERRPFIRVPKRSSKTADWPWMLRCTQMNTVTGKKITGSSCWRIRRRLRDARMAQVDGRREALVKSVHPRSLREGDNRRLPGALRLADA
jgi:hypothetical protein